MELDGTGEYLIHKRRPVEFRGTDQEALALAWNLVQSRAGDIAHVEAVSVGCPAELTTTSGRLLVWVAARKDGKGWTLEGQMMHGSWHRTLRDAVEYGAFRTAGYESETRIVDIHGRITHVVLIPKGDRKTTLY